VTGRATAAASISKFVSKNTPAEALDEAQKRMYRFFNSANVAVSQCISPEFQNLLTWCELTQESSNHKLATSSLEGRSFGQNS
jgi:hypothetical protein